MGLCGKDPTKAPGCFPTFMSELNPCQKPWYGAEDKITGRTLDIPASFGPSGIHVILFKMLLTLLAGGTLVYCFMKAESKIFFFAHFTNLTLCLQCLYHLISLTNSMCPTLKQPSEGNSRGEGESPTAVRGRAKTTWYFFNLTAHASIIATILWWALEWQAGDKMKLHYILPHGPTTILVLLDGFWINRIPIRLFHWWSAVMPYQLAYMGWTLAHAYLKLGNPEKDDNDDTIYTNIDWKDDFVDTLVIVIIMILVVGPVLQFFLFLFSLYTWPICFIGDRRRYTTTAAAFAEEQSLEEKSTAQSQAEASIFASNWG